MNIFDVFILGIVEGITEFLPISSTAHLEITQRVLQIPITPFVKSFTLIVQVGALLGTALYILQKRNMFVLNWNTIQKISIACIPTLVVGFMVYELVKGYFFGNFILIGWALIIGGLCMMIAEYYFKKRAQKKTEITTRQGIILGLAQALAVIPGVSRSGAVLVAGYFGNIEKKTLAQFSFLIGLPVAFIASVYDVLKTGMSFSPNEIGLTLLGIFISGIFSYFSAGLFLAIINKYSLSIFAWYRIVVGVLILLFL